MHVVQLFATINPDLHSLACIHIIPNRGLQNKAQSFLPIAVDSLDVEEDSSISILAISVSIGVGTLLVSVISNIFFCFYFYKCRHGKNYYFKTGRFQIGELVRLYISGRWSGHRCLDNRVLGENKHNLSKPSQGIPK